MSGDIHFSVLELHPQLLATAISTRSTSNHQNQIQDDYTSALSDDESDCLTESDEGGDGATAELIDDDPYGWIGMSDDDLDEQEILSAEEMLGEDFEREAANNGIYCF